MVIKVTDLAQQSARFLNLMEGYGDSVKLYEGALNSAGATQAKYNTWLEGTEAHLNKLKATTERFWLNTFNSDAIRDTIDVMTAFVSTSDSIVQRFGALKIGMFALLQGFQLFKSEFALIKLDGKGLQGLIPQLVGAFKNFRTELENSKVEMNTVGVSTSGFMGKLKILRQTTLAQTVATGALELATFALNTALTMGLSVIITGVITKIASLLKTTADLRDETQQLMATYEQNVQTNNSNISSINSLTAEYDALSDKTNLSVQEHKRFAEIRNQIAQISPELVQGIDSEGNAMLDLKDGLEGVVKLLREKNQLEAQKLASKGDDAFKVMKDDVEKANKKMQELNAQRKQFYTYVPKNDGTGTQELLTTYEEVRAKYDSLDDKQSTIGLQLHEALLKISNDLKDNKTKMDVQASSIKDARIKFDEYALAVAKGEKSFSSMDDKVKEFATTQIKALDYSKMESWSEATSKIRFVIDKLASDEGKKLVLSMNDINDKYESGTMITQEYQMQIDGIVRAFSELLGLPAEDIRKLIQIDISQITKGAGKVDVVQQTIEKFAESVKSATQDIADINGVLDKHAQSGEWNLETIGKLSEKYPQLLGLLGDEKGLEAELIKIKADRINSSKEILTKQIKNEESYLNEIFKGYGTDVENFKNAEEAKLVIANDFGRRITQLNKEIIKDQQTVVNNIRETLEAVPTDENSEAYLLAKKKLNAMKSLSLSLEGQWENINTHIGNYFKLQQVYLNADKFLGTGSKNNDGKSNSGSKDNTYDSVTNGADKYLGYLNNINVQLQTQLSLMDDISKKSEYYQSIGDRDSLLKSLEEETKLYAEEDKLLKMLQQDVGLIETQKDSIGQAFKSNFSSMSNADFSSWTEADFQKKFEELFPSKTFTTKAQQEAYEKQKDLFSQLVQDWFAYSKQINDVNNQIAGAQSALIGLTQKRYEIYFNVLEKGFDEIKEKIDDTKYSMDMLQEGENYGAREQYAQQLVTDTTAYRDAIQDATNKLIAKRDTLESNSAEWIIINNQIKEYQESLEDANLELKTSKNLVEQIKKEEFDTATGLQDKIVNALRDKYNKEKEKELEAINKTKEAESERLDNEIKSLREQIDALQDDTESKQEDLARKKELLAMWQKEDGAYAQSKVRELQQEISDLEKDLAIKALEEQIKTKEEEKQVVEKNAEDETKTVEDKYTSLLDEQSLYAEASNVMAGKTQDEILEILLAYDEKYKGMGATLGKAYADALIAEIARAKDALTELENGIPEVPKPSINPTIPNVPEVPTTSDIPTPPTPPPPPTVDTPTTTTTTDTSSTSNIAWDGKYYRVGSKGDTVKRIQNNLNANGYSLVADGIFGSKTYSAVVGFQRKNGLVADGIIGPDTWEKLIRFNSGGYTGNWGTDGKLAILDEKERVLDQTQTKAFEHLIYDILPKFSFDYLSKFNEDMLKKNMVFNAPVVQNDIKITNNTPFDVSNNMNNLNRAIKEELKVSGLRIGLA